MIGPPFFMYSHFDDRRAVGTSLKESLISHGTIQAFFST